MQDEHITEKRTGQVELEYAMASKNIHNVLTDRAGSDEGVDDDPDTISTPEDSQGRTRSTD